MTDKLGHGRCIDPHQFRELFLSKTCAESSVFRRAFFSVGRKDILPFLILRDFMLQKECQDSFPGQNGRAMTVGAVRPPSRRAVRSVRKGRSFRVRTFPVQVSPCASGKVDQFNIEHLFICSFQFVFSASQLLSIFVRYRNNNTSTQMDCQINSVPK